MSNGGNNSWWSPFGGANESDESLMFCDNDVFSSPTSKQMMTSADKTQESSELFTLIKLRKWREAGMRVKAVPKEACVWIKESDDTDTVVWRQLAIHKACEVHAPERLVEMLISAHPRSVQLRNSNGDLPLHVACGECAGGAVINRLIYHYPDGARVKNDEGRLPLHLSCRQWNDVRIVKNLLVAYDQGARCADADGLTPLHCACGQNVDKEIVERLLHAFPEAVNVKDRWGRTPLAVALNSNSGNKDAVVRALRRDVTYWRTGLMDEVNTLKTELERTTVAEKEYSEKACTLEEELMNITSRSNEAAKSFREMKGSLESKNKDLVSRLRSANARLEEREQKIGQLIVENMNYKSRVKDLEARMKALTSLLPGMEEQREQMLALSKKWEESLREASLHVYVDSINVDEVRSISDQRQDEEAFDTSSSKGDFSCEDEPDFLLKEDKTDFSFQDESN